MEPLEDRRLLAASLGDLSAVNYLPSQDFLFQRGSCLSQPSDASPLTIARDYLAAHGQTLGVTPEQARRAIVTDQYTDTSTGVTHVYLRQEHAGLEVVNANVAVNVMPDGSVITAGGGFAPDSPDSTPRGAAMLSAADGLKAAAAELGIADNLQPVALVGPAPAPYEMLFCGSGASLDQIGTRLHYVATSEGLQLAWNYVLRTPDGEHWYDASVDVSSGRTIHVDDWTDNASYNVISMPGKNPFEGRQLLTDPYDADASPYGWHDTNGASGAEYTDTRGNNVFAQEDRDGNNTGGYRPDGGASLSFNFPLDLSQAPSVYQDASITNLFYWNNLLHDIHYRYGFTEAAGNFQLTNYSGEGLGGDAVLADAQDGSGLNNANFSAPPDGSAPRMQMYLWSNSPQRDGDLDSGVIVHEYGHGVSSRLVGGPSNASALGAIQSGGMGEGWSDWWALMFAQRPSDGKMSAYWIASYLTSTLRRYPYSFDMNVNPLTYGWYNLSSEVHDAGEIWCAALWDMNWLLIDKYGYSADIAGGYGGAGSAGNVLALQLMMDSLKLMPSMPTFLDGRDALLAADQVLTGGQNQRLIWTAFARRGMGFSADDGGSANAELVTEAFDVPPVGVVAHNPAGVTTAPLGSLDVVFSDPMDPASFSIADDVVSFVGPAGNDLRDQIVEASWLNPCKLRLILSPQSADGAYALVLGPQILTADGHQPMNQDGDATPGEPTEDCYAAVCRYDSLIMQVGSMDPGSAASLPLTELTLTFNEAYDAASAGVEDLRLSQGTVTGLTLTGPDTLTFHLSGVIEERAITIQLAAGALSDVYGNPMGAYSASLSADIDVLPMPELAALPSPAGSLASARTIVAALGTSSDLDQFTVTLDAGQPLAVLLQPSAALSAVIEIRDAGGVACAGAASARAGDAVLVDAFPAPARGTYTILVSSQAGSAGSYCMQVTLGTALEAERFGGTGNDSLPTAQPIDGSFLMLGPASGRWSVLGALEEGDSGDWYSFHLDQGSLGTVSLRAQQGHDLRVDVLDAAGNLLAVGALEESERTAQALFPASMAGTYYARVTGSETGYGLTVAQDALSSEGDDGQRLVGSNRVLGSLGRDIVGGFYCIWDTYTKRLSTLDMQGNQTELGPSGAAPAISGLAYDTKDQILYGSDSNGKLVTFDLTTGLASPLGTLPLSISYALTYNPLDDRLYSVTAAGALVRIDPDRLLATIVSGAGPGYGAGGIAFNPADDRIYAHIGKDPQVYSYDAATFSGPVIHPNPGNGWENFGMAYNGTSLVLGPGNGDTLYSYDPQTGATAAIFPTGFLGVFSGVNEFTFVPTAYDCGDSYTVLVASGDQLTIWTSTPGDGLQGTNRLDPRLELYAPNGMLIAFDENSAPDGRNAQIFYTAPEAGTYTIRIAASNEGDYLLNVDGATGEAPPPVIVGSEPADGATVRSAWTVTVDFSEPISLASVQGADLTVDGIPAVLVEPWAVNNHTVTFTMPSALPAGPHHVQIAPGAIASSEGKPAEGWQADFSVDTTSPVLVGDINPLAAGSGAREFVKVGSTIFFVAADESHGDELWKTDGTAAGTVMVKDIFPDFTGPSPSNLTECNGTLFFSASDGTNGRELWKSDGTEAGTVMVKDIYPGASDSMPCYLTNVAGVLFFQASCHLAQLWKSDGTEAGTVIVKDFHQTAYSLPQNLTNVDGTLFFSASEGANGLELWKSDGTEAGTVLVKDIYPGSASSSPRNMTAVGDILFFQAADAYNCCELWKSDGTAAGTVLVKDVLPNTGNALGTMVNFNGTLFFAANDLRGRELWKSDGTEAGTVVVKDIFPVFSSSPGDFEVVGDTLFFAANDARGRELWKSDGTEEGTVMVKDISSVSAGSLPQSLTSVGDTLFFLAMGNGGRELWKSDGTEAGTVLVRDIMPGAYSSSAGWLTAIDGQLVFAASDDCHGVEPWKSDGTRTGTVMICDIRSGTADAVLGEMAVCGERLFFAADDGSNGLELWSTDGTAAGTALVKDIQVGSGSSSPSLLTNVNGTLYFTASDGFNGTELWKSDGTAAGTLMVKDIYPGPASARPAELLNFNGVLLFRAHDGTTTGVELWRTDGTAAGTTVVKDIWPGSGAGGPDDLVIAGETVFFRASDGSSGTELWKSDGTPAGTVMVKDIYPGSSSSGPGELANVGGTVYFRASDGTFGFELWKSDGTEAGTVMVKNIYTGSNSSLPAGLVNLAGTLMFCADNGTNGYELWTSDGTQSGTVMLKDIFPGSGASNPDGLIRIGGTLYFAADDGSGGRELWKSNGTAAGTVRIRDIAAGSDSASPQALTNVLGTLYFTATDPAHGREIWISDGTLNGTRIMTDLVPGPEGGDPLALTAFGSVLCYNALDGQTGRELWTIFTGTPPSDIHLSSATVPEGRPVGTIVGTLSAAGPGESYTYRLVDGPGSADNDRFVIQNGILKTAAVFVFRERPSYSVRVQVASIGGRYEESLTVSVTDVNERPTAIDDVYTVGGGRDLVISAPGILANDTDADGNDLSAVIVDQPLHGVVVLHGDGSFTYTPDVDYGGWDRFTYYASDGEATALRLANVALHIAPPNVVKDIQTANADASPAKFVAIGGTTFFLATDAWHGTELWRTDGTPAGTLMVKDIWPGSSSGLMSYSCNLVNVNGTLFFNASDGVNGTELWKSDGTEAGTLMVKDVWAGSSSGIGLSNVNLANVNGTLFFTADNGVNGTELWKSDGTEAGTVMVKDIAPGSASSSPASNVDVSGTLFFRATDGVNGFELWKSDGTEAGTVMVKDIAPGSAHSLPTNLVGVSGTLFFVASDGTSGTELWKSDGTEAGTVMVRDIYSGSSSSSPANLVDASGTLFFAATNGTNGVELWKSDGTQAGTLMVKDIRQGASDSSPTSLTSMGGCVFFMASGSLGGRELWKSDGTAAGTVLVRDINPGSDSSDPAGLTNIGGTLFFSAYTPDAGMELWKSDGTEQGTVLVNDIRAGASGSMPANLAEAGARLFFAADDGIHGREIWTSDGTSDGTHLVFDCHAATRDSNPAGVVNLNGVVCFAADDGISGTELWRSDGTFAGTYMVKDIAPGANSSSPANLTVAEGILYFVAQDATSGKELWRSDGTEAGTYVVKEIQPGTASSNPQGLVNVNGTIFFQAFTSATGSELWKSDGTENGTVLVKDIYPGNLGSAPSALTAVGNTLYFNATAQSFGNELWRSDGTEAGTVMVKDIRPGSSSSSPSYSTAMGNVVFFAASTANGSQLWKSDGTEAGTVMVKDIYPGSSSSPISLTVVGDTLYFQARTAAEGSELWKTDGTEAGTLLVKDIWPGSSSSSPAYMANLNGTLYFRATDGTSGSELWTSDGTEAGTTLVKDIWPGPLGSNLASPINFGGTLYFVADDGTNGAELWQSDGSGPGTRLRWDIVSGAGGSSPQQIVVANGILFFSALDPFWGRELWSDCLNGRSLDIQLSPNSVPESQPPGALVGILSTSDTDVGNTFTYALIAGDGDTDNALFTIAPGGELRTNAVLDYEDGSPYSIRVQSTDQQGISTVKILSVVATDVNAPPSAISLASSAVPENLPPGAAVGVLTATDEAPGAPFLWTLAAGPGSTDNASFQVVGDQLLTNAIFDYETRSSYSIRVRAVDAKGLWYEQPLTILVTQNLSDLDADGNGLADPLSDGILILRYLFEPTGTWNIDDALGGDATRTSQGSIKTFLDAAKTTFLDADGNGAAEPLSDGILILRYLFDPAGAWRVDDALGSGATRTTREDIKAYLDQFNPALSPTPATIGTTLVEDAPPSMAIALGVSAVATAPASPLSSDLEQSRPEGSERQRAAMSRVKTVGSGGAVTGFNEKLATYEGNPSNELRAVDSALECWDDAPSRKAASPWLPDSRLQAVEDTEEESSSGALWADTSFEWLPTLFGDPIDENGGALPELK